MIHSVKQWYGRKLGVTDGLIGSVKDFYFDDQNWAICHLIVETGHLFFAKEIAILPTKIDHISYEESKVFVKLTKKAIQAAPPYHTPLAGV